MADPNFLPACAKPLSFREADERKGISAILAVLSLFFLFLFPAQADEAQLRTILAKFADAKGFPAVEAVVRELGATGDPAVSGPLEALSAGDLYFAKADKSIAILRDGAILDPLSGAKTGEGATSMFTKIRVNNGLRGTIRDVLGSLTLSAPDPAVRLSAVATIFNRPDPEAIPALDAALAKETDATVKARMEEARAAAVLASDLPEDQKRAAIETLGARGDRAALTLLSNYAQSAQGSLRDAAENAADRIRTVLAGWDVAQNVWFGLSLGSVLLLAAIGLAITFGVMGVINMAHGEMVMLGAYTTFAVQEAIRASAPGLFDWSLAIALPAAFLVAGAVGFAMERGIIRFLYGRPLETLLATWGVSLILQQAVRVIFGPNNREVGNPTWMSGSFEIGQMAITWNRLWIVLFAGSVFLGLLYVMKRTPWGLQMRAVTQNRRMAASMGIRTPWVDAFTFALGPGIAGIAGVALSQIGNVSPNLGQSYIIDSFMVVVFGGVGNLWGTLVGALSLGVLNKFLEPYAGAVLSKIIVLVLIILFIQKRPRGLFALKGRAVEA